MKTGNKKSHASSAQLLQECSAAPPDLKDPRTSVFDLAPYSSLSGCLQVKCSSSRWQLLTSPCSKNKEKKRKAGRGEEMKEGKREGRESQGSKLSTFLNLGNLFKHPLADFPSAHRNRVGCMTVLKPTPSAGYETQRRAHSNHGSPRINREVEQWTKSGLFHHLTSMEGEQPSQRKGWSEWWVIHTPPYMQDKQSEAV